MIAAALALLSVLPFLPAIAGGEIFDDRTIHQDSNIGPLIARRGRHWRGYDRLLTRLTHWATKGSPILDHGFNIAIHVVNVQLVFNVLGLVTSPTVAMQACAIFAVHPLQVHAVGYVSARAGLLSFFFAIAIVRVLLGGHLWGILGALPLLAFLGSTTKEDFAIYLLAIAAGAAWINWG